MTEDDADIELVPKIVEKVLPPKVTNFFTYIWEPSSTSQTQKAFGLIKELLVYVDITKLKVVFNAILTTIQTAIDSVILPNFDEQHIANETVSAFAERQFFSTVKLLKNITLWGEFLPEQALQKLSMENLINNKLLPFVKNTSNPLKALEYCSKVIQILPSSWFSKEEVPAAMALFQLYLVSLCRKFAGAKSKTQGDKGLQQALTLLLKIGDNKGAHQLAEKYKIGIIVNKG